MKTQIRKRGNASVCCSDVGKVMQPALFKALADPNRSAILGRLAACCGACTVSEIAECCPVNVSVVSRHLAMLRDAGVLEARKQGKQVYYTVRYLELVNSLRRIADALEACCPAECRAERSRQIRKDHQPGRRE